MVKHIIISRLTNYKDLEDKRKQLKLMEDSFSVLGEKLSYIVEYRTGINTTEAGHAWDFVIDSVFASRSDLEKYQHSEEHLESIRKTSGIAREKALVDYEF